MADHIKPPGPTGDFPRGRLNADDEGGLRIAVGPSEDGGNVMVHFGSPVAWFALPPQQAADLAAALIKQARAVARETGELLTITIGG